MTALAKHDDYFSSQQIATIKSVICPGLTDPELGLFSEICKQTQLSPFARQIYVTKRPSWDGNLNRMVDKMTVQTGIDGYRLIADRTGKYSGQSAFEWCGPDGVWRDVWLSGKPPAAARATVHRTDWALPVIRVARWDAYVQTKKGGEPNSMWQKMGPEQLAKCAEALALRTAFPQELSGLYTDEEMGQADNETPPKLSVVETPKQERVSARARVVDQPAELSADAPRFSKHWKVDGGMWAGKPLQSASPLVLSTYIRELESKRDSMHIEAEAKQIERLTREIDVAAKVFDDLLVREAEKAEAAAAGADPETGELLDDDQPEGKGHQTFPMDAAGEPLT